MPPFLFQHLTLAPRPYKAVNENKSQLLPFIKRRETMSDKKLKGGVIDRLLKADRLQQEAVDNLSNADRLQREAIDILLNTDITKMQRETVDRLSSNSPNKMLRKEVDRLSDTDRMLQKTINKLYSQQG